MQGSRQEAEVPLNFLIRYAICELSFVYMYIIIQSINRSINQLISQSIMYKTIDNTCMQEKNSKNELM